MNLWFTTHAVERYQKRYVPHLTYNQALRLLIRAIPTAKSMRDKTLLGHDKWRLRNPDVILVTKPDISHRLRKKVFVVVTILPLETDESEEEALEETVEIEETTPLNVKPLKPGPEIKRVETKLKELLSKYDWFYNTFRMNRITVVVTKPPPKEVLNTFYPSFEGINVTIQLKKG